MTWTDNRKNKEIEFQDITVGDVFLYDDILYMRTEHLMGKNVVSLDNGEYDFFDGEIIVESVIIRLEIVG